MRFAAFGPSCVLFLCTLSATVCCQAQNVEKAQALKTLEDAADHFCTVPSLDQRGEELELSGDAKAALNGVIAKAIGLGISGAARYNSHESNGVLQKDLAVAIEKGNYCRLEVLKLLKEDFFPKNQGTSSSVPQHERNQSDIGPLNDFLENHDPPGIGSDVSGKIQNGDYGDYTRSGNFKQFTLTNSIAGSRAQINVRNDIVEAILLFQSQREGASTHIIRDGDDSDFNRFFQIALNQCYQDHSNMEIILQNAFPDHTASEISRAELLANFKFVAYRVGGELQEIGVFNVERGEKFVFGKVAVWIYILEQTIQDTSWGGLPSWKPACTSSVIASVNVV